MIIDKSTHGVWDDNSTYLDDIAYYIYLSRRKKFKNLQTYMNQSYLIKNHRPNNKDYKKAKIIIRQEKINKIKERIKKR
jgi:hypothetical protein